MFQETGKTKTLTYILISVGLFITAYVFGRTPKTDGLQLFFLLPLSFTVCCAIFHGILPYHREGWGLKVLYTIIFVRYLVVPFLTCSVQTFDGITKYSGDACMYGILMQVLELFVTCIVIKVSFNKTYNRIKDKYKFGQKKHYYDNLSIGGVLVILFSLFVISRRGLGNMLMSMRFLVLSEGLEEEAMYGYDQWMAHTLMAFLVIVISASFQKREDSNPSGFNIIIPLIFAFFSCSLSFGNNRMTSVYYAVSAIAILFMAFPRRKAAVVSTIIPTFIVVMISFTMIKQFGYDVTAGGDAGVGNDDAVEVLSAYVSTTQNIAKAYDMYGLFGNRMSIDNVISDFVHGIVILQLPMFHGLTRSIMATPTSVALASTGAEVVPVAGQALFYGGYYLGWLFDIVFFVIIVRLLIITDCYSKMDKRLGNKYLFTWISVTFGMMMAYNMSIIWSSLNSTPLFTLAALWINRSIRVSKQSVKEHE